MEKFEKFVRLMSLSFLTVSMMSLLGILIITVIDILGIKLINKPVPGGIEIVGYLGAITISFSLPYIQYRGENIYVDFFIRKFSRNLKKFISILTSLLGITLFVLLSWQSYYFGVVLKNTKEISPTLRIPFYPIVYGIALCSLGVGVVLFYQTVKSIYSGSND